MRGHFQRGRGQGWLEQGYRFVSYNGARRALHRVIVEQREGRTLARNEVVHHVDRNKLNNDPANLVLLSRAEHTRLHRLGQRGRWAQQERRRAAELYATGMNIDEVARTIGRPYSSTRTELARQGLGRAPAETRRLRKGALLGPVAIAVEDAE